ncbi:acyltransferase family protein [Microbulbifer aggregans]|uniref:acyltransferase family protein n=1 Tax=Microbulbifer aggregans TaxID=1769779 RepID=UPI001D04306E|nr:acyltransferase [Microbulbifer aggregans]
MANGVSVESRAQWVDYAKAIGIILVVYGHVARGLFDAGIPVSPELFLLVESIVYSFHMPLFFFLSGLFFEASFRRRGPGGLVLSKLDTIVYPYILWSLLQGSIEVFLSKYTNGSVGAGDVFSFLWEPRAQFWFLYALFILFCVATLIFSLLRLRGSLIVFSVLAALLYIYQPLAGVQPLGFLVDNLVYFLLGALVYRYGGETELGRYRWAVVLGAGFLLAQYWFHATLGLTWTDKGAPSLLLGGISILFVVSLSVALARSPSKIWLLVGSSSMAIYLMHVLAGAGVRVVLQKLAGVDAFLVHLGLGMAVGLIGPILALEIIKRLNIRYLFSAPISSYLMSITTRIGGKGEGRAADS